jgi:hypothetical protein
MMWAKRYGRLRKVIEPYWRIRLKTPIKPGVYGGIFGQF